MKFGGDHNKPVSNIQKKRELKLNEKVEALEKREKDMGVNDYLNEREQKL